MKINLHCHSSYSDGGDPLEMAQEYKKQGYSAFVVTDHVYPMFFAQDKKNGYSMCITSYEKYKRQTAHLQKIANELDFPCIQGIELALYGEEVLVFGEKVIHDIFAYLEKLNLKEQEKYGDKAQYKRKITKNLIDILQNNKKDSAVILCHPHLIDTPQWTLEPLYNIIDGYEFQNGRTYYFTDSSNSDEKLCWDREIPAELRTKNKFYNSDAHSVAQISRNNGNFHEQKITSLEDLISYIKTPQNIWQNMPVYKRTSSRQY